MKPATPAAERFWRWVDDSNPDGCWLWTGRARGPAGHGRFQLGGRGSPAVYAHRYVYEMRFGPLPRQLVVRHLCNVAACVNPAHLAEGPPEENVMDWILAGRRR